MQAVRTIHEDTFFFAWMFIVGAIDINFLHAHARILGKILQAKDIEPAVCMLYRTKSLKIP